jgi:pimeloyl-ACP methyl ester carboxylesterase
MKLIPVLLLAVLAASRTSAAPTTFVLVHGAFQDQSAWSLVAPRLEAAGHKVIVLQRPGRSPDNRPAGVVTLKDNVDLVVRTLRAQSGPVVLVGHSFAGIIISQAAEEAPEKIAALVYVAAYLPRDGESLGSLSATDTGSELPPFLRLNAEKTAASVSPEGIVPVFCADAPADLQAAARAHPVAEPLLPTATPVHVTEEKFGRVRKIYLHTLADRCVSPAAQQAMLAATPVEKVVSLRSSHSPFWSVPAEVTAALLAVP